MQRQTRSGNCIIVIHVWDTAPYIQISTMQVRASWQRILPPWHFLLLSFSATSNNLSSMRSSTNANATVDSIRETSMHLLHFLWGEFGWILQKFKQPDFWHSGRYPCCGTGGLSEIGIAAAVDFLGCATVTAASLMLQWSCQPPWLHGMCNGLCDSAIVMATSMILPRENHQISACKHKVRFSCLPFYRHHYFFQLICYSLIHIIVDISIHTMNLEMVLLKEGMNHHRWDFSSLFF